MERIELHEEARETFLQVLLLADNRGRALDECGDIAGKESLEKEVIAKYEELFLSLEDKMIEELSEEQREEFQKILEKIQEKHHFSKDYIQEKRKLRKELAGHSGAEVVKKLFEYQKKELETQKRKWTERARELLQKEEIKCLELCNVIQEKEQLAIMEELQPIQREYQEVSEKRIEIQKKIDYTVIELGRKWKYEIFGTIPEQKLRESYKEFAKEQKK